MRMSAGMEAPKAGLVMLPPLVNPFPLTPDFPCVLIPLPEPFSPTGVMPAYPRQAAAITPFVLVDGRAGI